MAGAAVGLVPFLLVLWDFGIRPLRRATEAGTNADFFDVQARALLDGRLDVPPGSLGIEAFVVDGRHYMYFGPFPALLRIPVLLATSRLDGRLTALSMLAGWLVLAAATVLLVGIVRRRLRGAVPVGRLEAVALAAVVAAVTGGSTVVYLASLPWVYHEVYVWSTALAVATVAALIAAADDPRPRHIAVTGALVLATMLTRATAGWALALAVLATGVWLLCRRSRRGPRWRSGGAWLVAAGAGALLVGSLVNWAKFHHPYRFPIADQVWTALSPQRRLVLADNGGDLDGLRFVPTTVLGYLRPDGVRLTSTFPFITPPAAPPQPIGDVLLDESWRTGSVPALMPLLFLLAVWGAVVVFRTPAASAVRIPLLGCAAMTAGVLGFGHVAPRYTSEFVPLLAVGAVVGVVDVVRRLGAARPLPRRGVLLAMCALAAFGIGGHVAIGSAEARLHGRGDRLAALVALQLRLDLDPDRRVVHVGSLPSRGAADQLAVVGDCDALYLGTGETLGPWVPVEHRERRFRIAVLDATNRSHTARLMTFTGGAERTLSVETDLRRLRLAVTGGTPPSPGAWIAVHPGDTVEVTVVGDTAANRFVGTAVVAGRDGVDSVVSIPMTEWNADLLSVPVEPREAASDDAATGLSVSAEPGRRPPLCAELG